MMRLFQTLLLTLTLATLTSTADAAQVFRSIGNTDPASTSLLINSRADNPTPNRQMFLNPLDVAQALQIQVGGNMVNVPTSTLTVKLYDACGNLVTQASRVFDNSGLTTPSSKKWVEVGLGSVALVYGAYYYMDLTLPAVWSVPNFVVNTDKFYSGTFTGDNVNEVWFPDKKKDVLFILTGTADSSKPNFPSVTTNIACQDRCFLANPSGVENVSYGPERQFNVLIRERVGTMFPPKGSFWTDYTNGNLPALKQEIANMIQGTATDPALRETYPYNNYSLSGAPFYYPQMNFYVAVEDPAVDRFATSGYGHRGFHHCANIDAVIEVVTGGNYGGSNGKMWGEVGRTSASASGWGVSMRGIAVHEVFGHGIPALMDEYASTDPYGNYHMVDSLSAYGYQPNALPISTGCNEWCGGTQSVGWLVGQMSADPEFTCWTKTTRTDCESPGGIAACRWIGDLAPISYWGTYKCIPTRASRYNIGTNCPANGNHGCYPIAPLGTQGAAYMDVVQPSGAIMVSTHQTPAPATPGFTSHIEGHIKDLLDCVFGVGITCTASAARCTNIMARYGTPATGYLTFLQNAPVCEGTFLRRR